MAIISKKADSLSDEEDQIILELEDIQFSKSFTFEEKILDKEVPFLTKRINCIGKLKKDQEIVIKKNHEILIEQKCSKSFSAIKINIINYEREGIFGHLNFKESDKTPEESFIIFETGISLAKFDLLLEAIRDGKYKGSLTIKIKADLSIGPDYEVFILEEHRLYKAEIISFHFIPQEQSKQIIDLQKDIKKEKEEFLSLLRIRMFPDKDDEKSSANNSRSKNFSISKIFWYHQDSLSFFKKYKKIDTHNVKDFMTVSIISDLFLKYLRNPKLSEPYIDWVFLNFFAYQQLAQFALTTKQKPRKFLGVIKNKSYFSSIKLWLKMRDFYELLKPPILTPHLIKLKLIECYDHGIRWGEQDNISPLVYKIAASNPEYMVIEPL